MSEKASPTCILNTALDIEKISDKTTLSAKQMKLSSFINFYNKKLVETGPQGTKELVESISHLFGPIIDQISFLNQYLDYETSHNQEYKTICKNSIKTQKLQKKTNDTYQKSLQKYQVQFHKIFIKTLKTDNAFADLILLHLHDVLLPLLPPNQTNPKHAIKNLPNNCRINPKIIIIDSNTFFTKCD